MMVGKIQSYLNYFYNPRSKKADENTVEHRRREAREELTDGDAYIDGHKYPLQNWSASGYSVGPCNLEPRVGGRMEIEFHVPLPSRELVFKTPCVTVRRVQGEGLIGGTYLGVDLESRKIIDEHFQVSSD